MSSFTSVKLWILRVLKQMGNTIRSMRLVVLTGYNMEWGLGEGQILGQTSSWETDVGNQGKMVTR